MSDCPYNYEEDREAMNDQAFTMCLAEAQIFCFDRDYDIVVEVFDEGPYIVVTYMETPIEAVYIGENSTGVVRKDQSYRPREN